MELASQDHAITGLAVGGVGPAARSALHRAAARASFPVSSARRPSLPPATVSSARSSAEAEVMTCQAGSRR